MYLAISLLFQIKNADTEVKDISKYFEFKMDGTIKVAKSLTKVNAPTHVP